MKLLVATHVPHWLNEGRVMSSAYFVRDLRIFSDFFEEVHICAPLSSEAPHDDAIEYGAGYTITDCPMKAGTRLSTRLGRLLGLPGNVARILKALRYCDAVHVRCADPIGLAGAIATLFSSKPKCAKYAGQWANYDGERLVNRIQKSLLSRRGFKGPVTVNAKWQGNRGHIYSVFNTSITREQMEARSEIASRKRLLGPARFLFVGRIDRNKNVDCILRAFAKARAELVAGVVLDVVGDGPARATVEVLAQELGLSESVVFHGRLHQDRLNEFYSQGQILVLVSDSEGWPKTPMEAMSYGLPSICSNISTLPMILGDNERGLLVKPGDVKGLTEAMTRLATDEKLFARLSRAGRKWIENKTREDLMIQIKAILEESWEVKLRTPEWMNDD